jgi:hypothetical protein
VLTTHPFFYTKDIAVINLLVSCPSLTGGLRLRWTNMIEKTPRHDRAVDPLHGLKEHGPLLSGGEQPDLVGQEHGEMICVSYPRLLSWACS